MLKHYRAKNDILYEVLNCCNTGYGVLKTHLMYKANLSHDTLKAYTRECLTSELIELRENRYYITDKGLELINKLAEQRDDLNFSFTPRAPRKS